MTHIAFRLAASTSALAAILWTTSAQAEGVDAGTLIENTASATYDDGAGTITVPSNTVSVRVDEILDVAVTSVNSGPVAASRGSAVLTFEVTNVGNGPEAFTLTANPSVANNDFETTIDTVAIDSNGNGVYDQGVDQILTGARTTPLLDADASVTVFVLVTVPNSVTDRQTSEVELLADAVTGTGTPGLVFANEGVDGGDAVVGATGADDAATGSILVGIVAVDLVKAAAVSDPFGGTSTVPGATVTYTITADVTGTGSASDLVITDTFPAGTSYVAGSLKLGATALSDASDGDAGEAGSTGISVDVGDVAGGTSRSVTFDVTID